MQLQDVEKFHDGRLVLYRRGGKRKTYHARILRDDGGYVFRTTKRTDLFEARRVAEDWFDQYRDDVRHGRVINVKSFSQLFKSWLDEHRRDLSTHRYRYIRGTGERYLIPYFGDAKLDKITNGMIAAYWSWRLVFWSSTAGEQKVQRAKRRRWSPTRTHRNTLDIVAKTPSQSSLTHEQAVLRRFYKWAKAREFVRDIPIIEAPKKAGRKPNRRPSFELAEWQKLQAFMKEWVDQELGMNGYTSYHRCLIRNVVRFMAGTGMRPNEVRQLKWSDIKPFKNAAGEDRCVINVSPETKTGTREVVPLREAREALFDMGDIQLDDDRDYKFVFSNRDDVPVANLNPSFKSLLRKAGLLTDSFGAVRSLYSLRHFYASQRLLQAVPIDDLAQNLGTGIKMIVQHYSHLTTRMREHIHSGSLED